MIKSLLLHPRMTLAAMIAGLSSLATGLVSTIIALRPLENFDELVLLRPWIVRLDFALGSMVMLCLILCAIGRSILVFVDDDGKPQA